MALFPTDISFSSRSHIGQIGGIANVAQGGDAPFTRPSNTTAYSANAAIGSASSVLMKLTGFFRTKSCTGLITGARLIANGAGISTVNMGAVTAHLYNAPPSAASGLVDQGTFNTLYADDGFKLATIAFASWAIGGGGSDTIESYGTLNFTPQPIVAAASAADLYAVLVAAGAFTPLAGQLIQLYLSAIMD